MDQIADTGTIWIKGTPRPEYAVRVGEKIFVVGKTDMETVQCWVDAPYLYVDRHDPAGKTRTALRFDLNLQPTNSGSPFKGFTQTSHKDTKIVTYNDQGVEIFVRTAEDYAREGSGSLDSREFAGRAVFK